MRALQCSTLSSTDASACSSHVCREEDVDESSLFNKLRETVCGDDGEEYCVAAPCHMCDTTPEDFVAEGFGEMALSCHGMDLVDCKGKVTMSNLEPCCCPCNSFKCDRDFVATLEHAVILGEAAEKWLAENPSDSDEDE